MRGDRSDDHNHCRQSRVYFYQGRQMKDDNQYFRPTSTSVAGPFVTCKTTRTTTTTKETDTDTGAVPQPASLAYTICENPQNFMDTANGNSPIKRFILAGSGASVPIDLSVQDSKACCLPCVKLNGTASSRPCIGWDFLDGFGCYSIYINQCLPGQFAGNPPAGYFADQPGFGPGGYIMGNWPYGLLANWHNGS